VYWGGVRTQWDGVPTLWDVQIEQVYLKTPIDDWYVQDISPAYTLADVSVSLSVEIIQ